MSRPKSWCTRPCCRKDELQPQILPPYTEVHQRNTYVGYSEHRHQQTLAKVSELVKNQEKAREDAKKEQGKEYTFALSFRRKYVNIMTRKLSAVVSNRDKMKKHSESSSSPLGESETDLDKVTKEHHKLKQKDVVIPVLQPEIFTTKHGRASMEGGLLKFTNLVKGYRPRWFVLSDEEGTLQYFEKKEHKRYTPKGYIYLGAAKVSAAKGGNNFTVHAVSGEIYKLKAYDAREKQLWVERIRGAADYHTRRLGQPTTILSCEPNPCVGTPTPWKPDSAVRRNNMLPDSLKKCKEHFRDAEDFFKFLDSKIMELPVAGMYMNSLDTNLLLLKAMSAATLQDVHECIYLLHLASVQFVQTLSPRSSLTGRSSQYNFPTILDASVWSLPNPADEVPDCDIFEDTETDKMDDHKTIIIHLLSQLKLGMDLSKVSLPTFILEKRSLLELFTDCMAHPDMFIKIASIQDPEKRFLAVMEWYLSSFHSGRLGTSAKKPYNPIIGETFHCSWRVPGPYASAKEILLTYTAEQVSHHPPVTAFYVECPEKKIKMNSSIYTKSKFMGMSMGVSLVGKVLLHLAGHEENYVFSLPSAYARSILTVPWVELGDKIQLTCEKTGFTANIIFHTKPFYGGKLHHVTAEAKNQKAGQVICKVNGEWNRLFEFTYPASGQDSQTMDVNTLQVYLKYVRPLEKQKEYESRKLWFNVTDALSKNDMQKATEYKVNVHFASEPHFLTVHIVGTEDRKGGWDEVIREHHNFERWRAYREKRRKEDVSSTWNMKLRYVNGVWLYKTLPDDFALGTKT